MRSVPLGQHALERGKYTFCATWVTLVSNWSVIIDRDFRTRKMILYRVQYCFSSTWVER